MRICFFAGASSIHTVRWVNAMVELKHEVSLITMHPPESDYIDDRVKIHLLKHPAPKGYYLNIFEARNLVKKINPDLVNAHYASGYGTLARLVNFKPLLLSVWGSDVFDFPNENRWKLNILRKNLRAATQIASTSWIMKKQTEKFISPNLPIEVTPFGVDISKFKPLEHIEKDNTITIGIVKKLEEKYGVRYLLEAVSSLLIKLKDSKNEETANKIRLLVVGGGGQLEEMKELAVKLNIENISAFTGPVPHDHIPTYLNKLDIYCAPSILDSESFGVAVVEASACGIPVVVSDVGGLPEVVENEVTGYIVKNKNAEDISEKLFNLVLDKELRLNMGIRGREFVEANYNWVHNVKKMEKVYRNLLN